MFISFFSGCFSWSFDVPRWFPGDPQTCGLDLAARNVHSLCECSDTDSRCWIHLLWAPEEVLEGVACATVVCRRTTRLCVPGGNENAWELFLFFSTSVSISMASSSFVQRKPRSKVLHRSGELFGCCCSVLSPRWAVWLAG